MSCEQASPILGSLRLCEKVQTLEKSLKTQKITFKKRDDLFHFLDKTRKSMELLQKKALLVDRFAKMQIEASLSDLKEKIVSLYGRIDTLSIDYEVAQVLQEAEEIENGLKNHKSKKISKAVHALKKHINWICHDYALSRKNRKAIALARLYLENADALLKGKSIVQIHPQNSKIVSLNQVEEDDFFEVEFDNDAIELFEIAYMFYNHKTKEALMRLNKLPEYHRDSFRRHMKSLKGDTLDLQFDVFKTIKALIATAHQVSDSYNGQDYLSRRDIRRLFKEVEELRMQERKKNKHLSLYSNRSLEA